MRKVVIAAAFLALLGSEAVCLRPALGDVWTYKSGLWEETSTSATEDITPPPPRRFCFGNDYAHLVSFPGPDLYESETCREKVLSKSDNEREVEVVCGEPALRDRPVRPIRERHHFVKDGRGMSVDRRIISVGLPRLMQTTSQSWIGEDCGTVAPE